MALRKNILWNLGGNILPMAFAVIAVPFIIKYAGVERFGILTMAWALIGYFSLFDFGLGRALTQKVSFYLSQKKENEIPSLVKSGLGFVLGAGVVGGLLILILAYPLAHKWLNISEPLQEEAFIAFCMASIGIPITTLSTGLRGVLEAYEEFKSINIYRSMLGIANFALPALTVYFISTSLLWMIFGLLFIRVINLIAFHYVVNNKFPKGWLKNESIKSSEVKNLLNFGAWMTVSNIVSPLMVTADRFIISSVLGASLVAYYTVPAEMMQRILILPVAYSGVLFPKFAKYRSEHKAESDQLYRKSLLIIAAMLGVICLTVMVLSHWGMELWLGKEFADQSWKIVVILAAGIFFNGLAAVPFAKIQAQGHVKITALLHIFECVIYFVVLLLALHYAGIEGAAIAWSFRVLLDLILLMGFERKLNHE